LQVKTRAKNKRIKKLNVKNFIDEDIVKDTLDICVLNLRKF